MNNCNCSFPTSDKHVSKIASKLWPRLVTGLFRFSIFSGISRDILKGFFWKLGKTKNIVLFHTSSTKAFFKTDNLSKSSYNLATFRKQLQLSTVYRRYISEFSWYSTILFIWFTLNSWLLNYVKQIILYFVQEPLTTNSYKTSR